MKKYREGAMKRKLGIAKGEKTAPGAMIGKMNAIRGKKLLAVKGLI